MGVNCLVTAFGETKRAKEWALDSRCKNSPDTIYRRIKNGSSPEEAIGRPPRVIREVSDLIKVGHSFGYLVVIENSVKIDNKTMVRCKCVCGDVRYYISSVILRGGHKSCGCMKGIGTGNGIRIHGMSHSYKGNTRHRLYGIWSNMKTRCKSVKNRSYHNYGGRGISVDSRFEKYIDFYNWSIENGYKDGLTIDRIDNNGNYSPNNCRWVSIAVQQSNKRTCIMISAFGEVKNLTDWSKDYRCSISPCTLKERIFLKGMNAELAISTPNMSLISNK